MTPIAFLSEATEKVRRHLEQRLKVRPNTNESWPTRSRRLVWLTDTGAIHDQDVESQHQADSNAAAVICWNYLFRVPVRRFEECLARTGRASRDPRPLRHARSNGFTRPHAHGRFSHRRECVFTILEFTDLFRRKRPTLRSKTTETVCACAPVTSPRHCL